MITTQEYICIYTNKMLEESQIKQQLTWKKQQQIMKNLLRSCSIKFQPKFCGRQRTFLLFEKKKEKEI